MPARSVAEAGVDGCAAAAGAAGGAAACAFVLTGLAASSKEIVPVAIYASPSNAFLQKYDLSLACSVLIVENPFLRPH
jgi:hypothetical protein